MGLALERQWRWKYTPLRAPVDLPYPFKLIGGPRGLVLVLNLLRHCCLTTMKQLLGTSWESTGCAAHTLWPLQVTTLQPADELECHH